MSLKASSSFQMPKGFSLIEILVTLVILSIGLLGLAGMQVWSFKNTTNSNYSTLATFYVYDMAERMRSNKAGVEAGDYDNINGNQADPGCGTPATAACATTAEIAQLHAFEWVSQLQRAPEDGGMSANAEGSVTVEPGTPNYLITVTWKEQDINVAIDDEDGLADKTFSMRVSL